MAVRVLPFPVTIPAGTPESAPVTIPLALDNWVVEQIDLDVPPGPGGLVGFQVYNNGVALLPYGAGEWIIWDNKSQSFPLENLPTGSGWAVVGYNTGSYPHTINVRMHVSPPSAQAPPPPPTVVTFVTSDTPVSDPVVLGV